MAAKRPPRAKKTAKSAAAKKSEESPFIRVWNLVQKIPRGKVATYGQLSELIGRRLTPLAIGWAINSAPTGAIPWQRVVNASGGISTDKEHPGLQKKLLEREGIRFDAKGRIDLEEYGWRPRMR